MQPSALEPIYRLYESLAATSPFDPEAGLGGKLLYAGEINPHSSHLLYAASIAGAASLAASPNPALQRQAIRDGVIDFLVTSLEEALRILKNEIRKHQTVSVAVSIDSQTLVDQMLDRGVLPDLLPSLSNMHSDAPDEAENFVAQGAKRLIDSTPSSEGFVCWSVDRNPARWLPRLDACAQGVVPAGDLVRHRWLRLAPRYLGQLARRQHGIALSAEEIRQFESGMKNCVSRFVDEGEETVQITLLEPTSR
jgi:hypothetical protein